MSVSPAQAAQSLATSLAVHNQLYLSHPNDLQKIKGSIEGSLAEIQKGLSQLDEGNQKEFMALQQNFQEAKSLLEKAQTIEAVKDSLAKVMGKVAEVTARILKTPDPTGLQPIKPVGQPVQAQAQLPRAPLTDFPLTKQQLVAGLSAAKNGVGAFGEAVHKKVNETKPENLPFDFLVRLTLGAWLKNFIKQPNFAKNECIDKALQGCPEIFNLPAEQKKFLSLDIMHVLLHPMYQFPDALFDSFILNGKLPVKRISPQEERYFNFMCNVATKVQRARERTPLKAEMSAALTYQESAPAVVSAAAVKKTDVPPVQAAPAAAVSASPSAASGVTLGASLVDEDALRRERAEAEARSANAKFNPGFTGLSATNNFLSVSAASNFAFPDFASNKSPLVFPSNNGLSGFSKLESKDNLSDLYVASQRAALASQREELLKNNINNFFAVGDFQQAKQAADELSDPTQKAFYLSMIMDAIKAAEQNKSKPGSAGSAGTGSAAAAGALKPDMSQLIAHIRTTLADAEKAALAIKDPTKIGPALEQVEKLKSYYAHMIYLELEKREKAKKQGVELAKDPAPAATAPASALAAKANIASATAATAAPSSPPKPPTGVAATSALANGSAPVAAPSPRILMEKIYSEALGKEYIVKALDAGVKKSKKTDVFLKLIERNLPTDSILGKAVDNGDCFFHAFAQALNVILKKRQMPLVTVAELRKKVAEKAAWVERECTEQSAALGYDFEQYRKGIANTGSNGFIPLWGHPLVDGKILCKLYHVNLEIFTGRIEGLLETQAEALLAPNQEAELLKFLDTAESRVVGRDSAECIDQRAKDTITLAIYPKHYIPVFKKADLA